MVKRSALLILVFSFCLAAQNTDKQFVAAKTIYVRQSAGNPELLVSVEKELRTWGRFTTLGSDKDADLILDLTPTANPQLLLGKGAKATAILSTRDGVRLWSVVKGGDWSMAGYTLPKVGKAIVEDLKKFAKNQK